MKKPLLIAPRNQTREVDEQEAARLLQTGSWCRVSGTAPISKGASAQRKYRAARTAEGKRELSVWIAGDLFDVLAAMRRPNEGLVDVVTRLIKTFQLIG